MDAIAGAAASVTEGPSSPDMPGRPVPLRRPFRHAGGHCYIADLPADIGERRADFGWAAPPIALFENGVRLGPGGCRLEEIGTLGGGRFCWWRGRLYFSAGGGADPNAGEAEFAVAWPDAAPLEAAAPASGQRWVGPDQPLRVGVIGLGQRGQGLAELMLKMPGIDVAGLCDLDGDRLRVSGETLAVSAGQGSTDWRDVVRDPAVDAVFVLVPDNLHAQMAVAAFAHGKHVFVEKPVATTVEDARAIVAAWRASGRVLGVGYVLRDTAFYRAIRDLVAARELGPVRTIALSDHLSFQHGASFMRRWHRSSASSGGLIVHKGCHDLDMACWLLDAAPKSVASFGGRDTFARPAPAPFCSLCEERPACPYADCGAYEFRTAAERADPTVFGLDRCVFSPDADIVDNQVVAFELDNGTRGTFTLDLQGPRNGRSIALVGDRARLDGDFDADEFEVVFNDGREPLRWHAGAHADGHGGGDRNSLIAFFDECLGRKPRSATASGLLSGLALALGAEQARRQNRVVTFEAGWLEAHA